MKIFHFVAMAFLMGLQWASAQPRDCSPGNKDFTLTTTGGNLLWRGIHLSVGHLADTSFRHGLAYSRFPIGEAIPARANLNIGELETVSLQDTPSLVRTGRLHLASNVSNFTRPLSINFGGIDIADLSFCNHHQVNLHCGSITYYASEDAAGMKCSLVIFDPADVVTP